MNIWETLPQPFTCLAPMEGVTDVVFRQVIATAGRPDLFFTEFTNVSSYASEKGRANALERLAVAPSDSPIIAQIWGKNPAHFGRLAEDLEQLGFSGIDLNFGCPDRHVNAAGGGAAMIRTPELAVECLRGVQRATRLPVSVKTRLGYSRPDEFRDWLPILFREHPAALTIHLRTKKEMSKVPAHYELIPEILALRDEYSPSTKLVINGDIRDLAHINQLAAEYDTHPEAKPRDAFKLPEGHPEVDIVQSSKSSVASFSPSRTSSSSRKQPSSRAKASDTGAGDTTKVFEKSEGRAGDTVEVLKELKETTDASNDCTDSASGCSLRSSNVSPECASGCSSRSLGTSQNNRIDGFMIGRGVFSNPYCFTTHTPTKSELLALFRLHLDLFDAWAREHEAKFGRAPSFEPLKHYFKIYINTFTGASELRARLMECKNTAEVRAVLSEQC